MSPPCQFFSSAHTIEGKDDDKNTATFMIIEQLLKVVRPRVATLEETSGLIDQGKHNEWFCSMIKSFTDMGYNVTWGLLQGLEYGVPSRRKRLWVIASW